MHGKTLQLWPSERLSHIITTYLGLWYTDEQSLGPALWVQYRQRGWTMLRKRPTLPKRLEKRFQEEMAFWIKLNQLSKRSSGLHHPFLLWKCDTVPLFPWLCSWSPCALAGKGGQLRIGGTVSSGDAGCASVWFCFPRRDFHRSNFKKPSQQLTESSLFIQIEGLLSSPRLCDSTCIFEGFTLLLMPLYPTMKAVIFRKLWGGSG